MKDTTSPIDSRKEDWTIVSYSLMRLFNGDLQKAAFLSYLERLLYQFGNEFCYDHKQVTEEIGMSRSAQDRLLTHFRELGYVDWDKPNGCDRRRVVTINREKISEARSKLCLGL